MKVLLLGVGMQGKAALYDLYNSQGVTQITAADQFPEIVDDEVKLRGYDRSRVLTRQVDVTKLESVDLVMAEGHDVVISLVPTKFVEFLVDRAIHHGISLVNTVYVTQGLEKLGQQAEEKGLAILPEFGLDPGIDLVLLGAAVDEVDLVEDIKSYGAGIPEQESADNPLHYKLTWTFEGVLKSYIRPAKLMRNGVTLEVPGEQIFYTENIHEIMVEDVGRLEAYPNGDALQYADAIGDKSKSLRNMGRYSLRWPGHSAFWRKLIDLRLLDDEPVVVNGCQVDRRKFLAAVIEPQIKLGADQKDITIIRIEVAGLKDGKESHVTFEVVDRRDLNTGFTSMNRTVGFTASIGAQLLGSGKITKRGLLDPVRDVPFELFEEELNKRGIEVNKKRIIIG